MFYDRTRKRWSFNTCDCFIEVTAWSDCFIEVTAWSGLIVYTMENSLSDLIIIIYFIYCVICSFVLKSLLHLGYFLVSNCCYGWWIKFLNKTHQAIKQLKKMKKELKAKLILQKFMENMPMVVEVVFQIKTPLHTILNTGNAVNYNIKHISTDFSNLSSSGYVNYKER